MVRRMAALIVVAASLPLSAIAANWALPPGASGQGRTPTQLTTQWWQWAHSMPEDVNPLLDPTGAYCAVGQQGGVWFLGGGYGSSKIRRVCTIPRGKAVFFPVINMVYWRAKDAASFTCAQAKRYAAINNETALDLFAELDGVPLPDVKSYRVSSERCFDIYGGIPEAQRPYNAYPSATDGYWLLLKPLEPGRHTLKFGGRYNHDSGEFGRMVQDIEYELIVD